MKNNRFSVRYNIMGISSPEGFGSIKGGFNNGCKDVCFLRLTGCESTLAERIVRMESSIGGNVIYKRVSELPRLCSSEDVEYYNNCLERLKNSGFARAETRISAGDFLPEILADALSEAVDAFSSVKKGVTESMKDNFAVTMLFRFDRVVPKIDGYCGKETVKITGENVVKPADFLFFRMLTRCGFDVLLLQTREDIPPELERLGESAKTVLGPFGELRIPEYSTAVMTPAPQKRETPKAAPENSGRIKMTVPQRADRIPAASVMNAPVNTAPAEKTMEELAQLAESVVMIAVHDSRGNIIGTGSGIMISEKGYILTNNHVARGGRFYTVRIEDDDEIYQTDEVIKYNQVTDLAVIRIDRRLRPIPIYSGKKPVRGQKVVAIGSPLGLFNSVSDGIISGFRNIDDVEMIQFTAPISHGSSGGAILNMNGEVIGISTAGIDAGQNLNLAVGYEYITPFIRGLI